MSCCSKKSEFRSDIAKAKGLGSAKSGSHHWLMQRVSAIGLLITLIWMVVSIATIGDIYHGGQSPDDAHAKALMWFSSPSNTLLCIFFVIGMFYHGALGLQVVIEDYVHKKCLKMAMLIGVKLTCFAATVIGVFATLSIYFKG